MPSLRHTLLIVALLLGSLLAARHAEAFVPPAITGHVTDTAHALSESERLALDKKLEDYRLCSTNEVAVLITDSLQGGNVEDAAYTTFNTWKVGKAGADNGVLLVIAPTERQIRIETGKGVGGQLTDVESFHIIRDAIKPELKANHTFSAVDQGTNAIGSALGGCTMAPADQTVSTTTQRPKPAAPLPSPSSTTTKHEEPSSGLFPLLAVVFGFATVIGVILYGALRDLTVMMAFPFAFVGATIITMIVGMATGSGELGFVTSVVSFFGIGIPLWRLARKRNGGPRAPQWADGSSGSSSSSWTRSTSSSATTSYTSSSSSSSSGGYGGSGYSGGGGSSGGGGASDSY